MRVKRGRFEVVPHPLPPVSQNPANSASRSEKLRQAAQNRLPSFRAFISGGQPISGASMCFDRLTLIWPAPASFSRDSIAPLIPENCHAAPNGVITISSMNIDTSRRAQPVKTAPILSGLKNRIQSPSHNERPRQPTLVPRSAPPAPLCRFGSLTLRQDGTEPDEDAARRVADAAARRAAVDRVVEPTGAPNHTVEA